jgi:hypothetical protein
VRLLKRLAATNHHDFRELSGPCLPCALQRRQKKRERENDLTYYDAWLEAPDTPGSVATAWLPEGRQAFSAIRDAIRSGRLRGEQVDHLVWRATVTVAEVEALMADVYGPPGAYEGRHDAGMQHLADKMRKLRAFIAALPADREFELKADEF